MAGSTTQRRRSRGSVRAHARRPATVAEFNELTGAGVDESAIVAVLEQLLTEGYLAGRASAMTARDADYLAQHGGVSDAPGSLVAARIRSEALARVMDEENLSVAQVANRMRISTSRVRHRLAEGTLYAYPSDGRGVERKIPAWQFRGASPAPHLAEVLAGLPETFSPAAIRGFALHAGVEDKGSEPVPLLDWLFDGRDPSPARALAESMRHTL
jgi:hypothetical protein